LEVWFLEVLMFEGLFQPTHLIIIFAIALLIFGPRKLPELGKGLGEGIRALKEGMKDNPPASTEQSKNPESKDTKS
jgi:sec-independent protein translocase protein TatA